MAPDPIELKTRNFPGSAAAADLLPARVPAEELPFHDGLETGRLVVQHCDECGRPRFPVAPVCPHCLSGAFDWKPVPAAGTVHSWVRYQRSYLPEFEAVVPYVVLTVLLADSVFIFGRLVEADVEPTEGMSVRAIVERWADDRYVLAFTAAGSV